MRFLSVAACALAASLLSASPSQAVWIESHMGDLQHEFTVVGEIPNPIEIVVGFGYDVTWGTGAGFMVIGTVSASPYSEAYFGVIRSPTGMHYSTPSNTFILSDTYRTIHTSVGGSADGSFVVNDVSVSFYLPDNLSIAAPVPEASTWAMLLIGFVGIAAFTRFRPSRAGIAAQRV